MEFEYRFDRADFDSLVEDSGFLRAKVKLTKPGVFPYLLPDGTVRKEAKLPEQIFDESFLKSLEGLVVTDGHPYEFGGLVNSTNYKALMKGIITNPRIEDGFVVADEILFDRDLISKIKSGEMREVSLGLNTKQFNKPGIFEGKEYDSVQIEMKANHVAHVPKGRIGPEARILLDGMQYAIQGEMNMPDVPNTIVENQEPTWVKKILDGFDKLFAGASKEESVKPVLDEKPKDQSLEIAAYKKEIEDLKSALNAINSNIGLKMDEAIQRESLIDTVKAVLPDANLRGLSNVQIKKELIKTQLPDVKLDSDEMVEVYYNASLAIAKEKAKLDPGVTKVVTDESDIQALKAKRLNLYEGGNNL